MAHRQIHKRAPQIGNTALTRPTGLPTNIPAPATANGDSTAAIVSASSAAPIAGTGVTTIVTALPIISLENGTPTTFTSYSTLTSTLADATSSSQVAKTSSSTPSKTSAAAASSSSHHASKSSSNLGTLIPAIVVPVVVVLLVSFALFWFFMRRRHHRELKNTDFVMAGKGEKLSSRSNSSRSAGAQAAEKSSFGVTTSEVKPFSTAPKLSLDDIGVARPLTPKDGSAAGSKGRNPNQPRRPSREGAGYQNFSGPRPSTSRAAGAPRNADQGRNRSNSSPAKRGPPPSAYHYNRERDPYGLLPPGASDRGPPPPRPTRGPSPNTGSRMAPSPVSSSTRSPPIGSGPIAGIAPGVIAGLPTNPRPAPAPPTGPFRDPSPTMNQSNRAPPPGKIAAPPPGAYNGASPISQYSPIVKETPNLGAIATFGAPATNTKPTPRKYSNPPPLQTKNLTDIKTSKENSRSASPLSPSFLSAENMAIARLANSSRLGFNTSASPSAETTLNAFPPAPISKSSTRQQPSANSPATQSSVSPKLPPPATRSQLIPLDLSFPTTNTSKQQGYFNNSSSKAASPTSSYAPTTRTNKNTNNAKRTHHHQNDIVNDDGHESDVSDLDHYEDIDAKSDVSSLNEIERFEFESRNGSTSQLGHGSDRGGGGEGSIRAGNGGGWNFRF